MDRFDTAVLWGLGTVGVLSLLLGIGSIVYATVVIKPHLEEIHERGLEGIVLAERGIEVLEAHSDALGALNPTRSNTLATMQELPTALEQGANLSQHAAEALSRSATTLREIEDDLGIILPNNALQRNAEALATSAQSLQGLSPVLYRLHEQTDTVAADLTQASQRAERLQKELQNADVTLKGALVQLEQTRGAFQSMNLPVETTRMIGMIGGIFIVMGVILLGMAGLWRRQALLTARLQRPRPVR